MKLNQLPSSKGARRTSKRKGQGPGSGNGKTAGRGHKGQRARKSGNVRPGFEGGQMPLHRRLPKQGFTNPFRKSFSIVNLEDLHDFSAGERVDAERLVKEGIVRKLERDGIKILGRGELSVALTVCAQQFSASAIEKIKTAGGTVEVVS